MVVSYLPADAPLEVMIILPDHHRSARKSGVLCIAVSLTRYLGCMTTGGPLRCLHFFVITRYVLPRTSTPSVSCCCTDEIRRNPLLLQQYSSIPGIRTRSVPVYASTTTSRNTGTSHKPVRCVGRSPSYVVRVRFVDKTDFTYSALPATPWRLPVRIQRKV